MYDEYRCGCIASPWQGRIRVCATHRLEEPTGNGGIWKMEKMPKIVRQYPANGEMPEGWNGR